MNSFSAKVVKTEYNIKGIRKCLNRNSTITALQEILIFTLQDISKFRGRQDHIKTCDNFCVYFTLETPQIR